MGSFHTNFNFHIWYKVGTWTTDNPLQKKTIYDVISLVMWLMCNLQIRNQSMRSSLWGHQLTLFVKWYPQCKLELHAMSGSWKNGSAWSFPLDIYSKFKNFRPGVVYPLYGQRVKFFFHSGYNPQKVEQPVWDMEVLKCVV